MADALLAVEALSQSANRAPPRTEHVLYSVVEQTWLSVQQVARLSVEEKERKMLLPGTFCVRKGRRACKCKRCGKQIPKHCIQIGYPSIGRNGMTATAVWLHVDCAAQDLKLVEIAHEGKRAMKDALLGSQHVEFEAHPTPSGLLGELTNVQAQGLTWLLQRERCEDVRGGILADEMGMGKTVEMISLLLASPVTLSLVVVPPTCLPQWCQELREWTKPGAIEVLTYAGAKRTLPEDLGQKRGTTVVLTTYATLEREFRRLVCQAEEQPNHKRRRQLSVEDDEMRDGEQLEEASQVDLWDEQLGLDFAQSTLFKTKWTRIILDEAHRIKNTHGGTSQAAVNLRGKRRWCISGTPVQNRIGDIYGLLRFLRMRPYGFYRCNRRGCDCECFWVRCWEGTLMCQACGHRRSQHRSIFASDISAPIRQFGFLDSGKTALERLRFEVFQKLMLRRTKALLDLPELHISIRKISLSPRESRRYKAMKEQHQGVLEAFIAEGTLMKNFGHVFSIIMRQRQAANHPDLPKYSVDSTCPFCQLEVEEEPVKLHCGRHECHEVCCLEVMRECGEDEITCPSCEHEQRALQGPNLPEALMAAGRPVRASSKINTLIAEISELEAPKCLVFSSFAHFLELIEYHLKERNVTCSRISGKTKMQERSDIIKQFNTEREPSVLCVSLQVGGEGLNLQAANQVFLMDPWWNPAAEQQAMQRCHRLGQSRPVYVHRFVSENTIEERILLLQERKQLTVDSTIGGSNSALLKLTSSDVQLLFRD
ncbi:unnamed protein product [Durusdinium trenchii]|uniref:Uncharacterized protein n=1 Tax=Durusdinium trenchii TaxID=1381693 RepID=A0ABP0RK71_9DINO